MKSLQWALSHTTGVLIKRGNLDTDITQGELRKAKMSDGVQPQQNTPKPGSKLGTRGEA